MKILDSDGVANLIDHFAEQALSAYTLSIPFAQLRVAKDSNYVVCGMGGSSFVIDILRDVLDNNLHVYTSRTYSLPRETNTKSLVCISSYSGNTEETLACYKEARARKLPLFAISAGGTLEKWARRDAVPFIKIVAPGVTQPRYSVGFQLGYHLRVLSQHGLIGNQQKVLKNVVRETQTFRLRNTGLSLAKKLFHRVPLLYIDSNYTSVVRVGSIKILESSKTFAHWNVLPEMNHNEINGFVFSRKQAPLSAVFLRTADSHPRITKRFTITEKMAKKYGVQTHAITLPGKTRFSRVIAGIALLDWTAFYLAQLNGVDPSPVDIVEGLKKALG